jgi:hypothetical protein
MDGNLSLAVPICRLIPPLLSYETKRPMFAMQQCRAHHLRVVRMPGLKVIGLVAGIVSAFASAASLYRDWREQKRNRMAESANLRLYRLVTASGLRVQEEYDRDFGRLGQVFARGDGNSIWVSNTPKADTRRHWAHGPAGTTSHFTTNCDHITER